MPVPILILPMFLSILTQPTHLVVLIGLLTTAGTAGIVVWWYLAHRNHHSAQGETEVFLEKPASSIAANRAQESAPPKEESHPLSTGKSATLAAQLQENNLRELVQERLADIAEENDDIEHWALALVDLLDELRLMLPSYSAQDAKAVSLLRDELLRLLREQDCELIDLDEWHSTQQRATQVEHSLQAGESPRILHKGASGLAVRGHLIRKQEVTLSLPSSL